MFDLDSRDRLHLLALTVTLGAGVQLFGCPGGGDDPVPAAHDAPATPPPAVIEAHPEDGKATTADSDTEATTADEAAPAEQGGA